MAKINRELILEYLKVQKPFLAEHFNIALIGIFGSFSRNEQSATSDIDIVYRIKEGCKLDYFKKIELEEYFAKSLNRKIELVNLKFMNPIVKFMAEKDIIYV